ncbi:MAG: hypothetical protein KKG59_03735 [Nanoarchaeota archaeon]|nr:hypothetical protein [Nanoarchaeota archaeon]
MRIKMYNQKDESREMQNMQKMHIKRVFTVSTILFALTLLMSSIVMAEFQVNLYSNEFSIATERDDLKVCSCGTRTDTYEITNVGNVASLFSISTESNINSWISLSQNTFELQPGNARKVEAYVYVPCDTQGYWNYNFKVQTNYGRQKGISRDVAAHQCQNIKGMLRYFNKTIDPCETAEFEIIIENVASFTEKYEVSLGEYDKYAQFSEKEVEIEPGKKKSVFVYVQMPCDVYGTIPLNFHIHSKLNGLDQYIGHGLIITRSYDYSIDGRERNEICSRVVSKIPVKFTNNAKLPNDYKVSFTGPSFASFEPTQLTLLPGESQEFDMLFNPGVTDEGMHTLGITSNSELGDITKTRNLNVDVQHCYDHQVNIDAQALDKVCCGKKIYTVNIRNSGMYTETFYLKLKSPLWARLSQEAITLRPGENQNIFVEADIPCIDDQFEVRIIAESASSGIRSDDVVTIHSYGPDSCTRIKVVNDDNHIDYYTKEFNLVLENAGVQDARYSLEFISQFFTTDVTEIDLAVGEQKTIKLDSVDLNGFRKGVYLDELRAENQDSGSLYKETIKWNLNKRGIFTRFVDYLSRSYVCLAFLLLFIIGVIFALILLFYKQVLKAFTPENSTLILRRVPYNSKKRTSAIILFIIVFLLLFLAAFGFSERPSYDLVQKPLYFEMYQNSELDINVADYFADPDNDPLMFYASKTENMAIDIAGETANVKPAEGFFGERNIVFIADDGKGGRAESAVITLKILEKPKRTLTQGFAYNCPIVFVAFLFVLWLVTFIFHVRKGRFVYFYRQNKPTKKPRRKK